MKQRIRRFKLPTVRIDKRDASEGVLNYNSFNNVWQLSVIHFINNDKTLDPYAGTVWNRLTGKRYWWYQNYRGKIIIDFENSTVNISKYVLHAIQRIVDIGHTHISKRNRKNVSGMKRASVTK